MPSDLSSQLKRLGALLRDGAEGEVEETKARLESAAQLYRDFVSNLIVSGFDRDKAAQTAEKLFGSTRVKFAAIDGSEDQRLVAGLAVFWGGAYASTGVVEFRRGYPPEVYYDSEFTKRGRGVSSCVPIYVDQVAEVDQAVMKLAESGKVTLALPLTEQAVVDNSSIAGWIMTFSELYLAYRMVVDEGAKIVLLDRSLSNTQTSLIYDTSRRGRWESECAICGLEVDGVPIDKNEMAYGRYHYVNRELKIPSARGDSIRYSIVYLLQEKGRPMSPEEVCSALGADGPDRRERVRKFLDKAVIDGYARVQDGKYAADPRYEKSWERLRKLVDAIGSQLFGAGRGNPMRLKKGEGSRWLTTRDMAFLALYCLYMLVEECWKRNVLLVGITKDTTARDFVSHLVPVCANEGIWKVDERKLRDIPTTDRMFLQSISMNNFEEVPVPWSLIEYDASFQTIVPDFKKRKGFVSGARKNRISAERLFVKTYVQLDQSKRDPKFRSNVLFIDRLAYPGFDDSRIVLKHEYGGAVEPVEVVFHEDKDSRNELQNLVVTILGSMGGGSIPEAFGHNRALFVADKVAKAQRASVAGMLDATGHWLMNSSKLRRFCFYMNTFRERRAEVERARGP
ncbi:MAG: DNA double-strand break repair nuclease NurA [Candidatus Brockarchaeota archaeon]|nr:DNA double-strand break repair nuclease NurA [Candidatus Brockarchaeota archaeon]